MGRGGRKGGGSLNTFSRGERRHSSSCAIRHTYVGTCLAGRRWLKARLRSKLIIA